MKLKLIALCAALCLPTFGQAKTFKWASASDIATWDIHSQNNALQNGIHAAVYESLVYYNSRNFKIEPVLATSWNQVSPTQLRVTLRNGVKFHDGSTFTADDAVFSIQRAMAKTSNFAIYTSGIEKVVKVNNNTIDIMTNGSNPVLLNQMTELRMMSKAWAEKNKSVDPKDIKTQEENFAHRNANGTGPFRLKDWKQDQRLVLEKNTDWWGSMEGNATEIV
jgi:peptide/nickel transport system substrate-binding protein